MADVAPSPGAGAVGIRLGRVAWLACGLLAAMPAAAQGPSPAAGAVACPPPPAVSPLPDWFAEIDIARRGEIGLGQFVAYHLRQFERLDVDRDGALMLVEFLRLAEPPFAPLSPGQMAAAERRAGLTDQFRRLNLNGDGRVARAEASADAAAGFAALDVNGDGRATEAEARAATARALAADHQACVAAEREARDPDANGDGFVDFDEFFHFETRRIMAALDIGRDGRLSLEEYLALAGRPDQNPPGQPTWEQRRAVLAARFRDLDVNRDGFVDRAELRAPAATTFGRLDRDGDGKLSPDEWRAGLGAPPPRPPTPALAPPAPPAKPGPPPAAEGATPGPKPAATAPPTPGDRNLPPGVALPR